MKKNTYMTPALQVVEAETQELLAVSGVSSDGIGYGGVDIDGSLDAAATELLLLDE